MKKVYLISLLAAAILSVSVPVFAEAAKEPEAITQASPEWEVDPYLGWVSHYNGNEKTISIPASGGEDNAAVTGIFSSAFQDEQLAQIEELVLPGTFVSIQPYTFADMPQLHKVKLSGKLEVIGSDNFRNCEALEEITIPARTGILGLRSFYRCPSLKKVIFKGEVPVMGTGCFTELSPDVVFYVPRDRIGAYREALPEGSVIKSTGKPAMHIDYTPAPGEMVFNPETGALDSYTGKSGIVQLPARINDLPLVSVGDQAFMNNPYVSYVVIPEGVETIGDEAFRNMGLLNQVDLPDSIRSIGSNAFLYLWYLDFHWPSSLSEIKESAFEKAGFTGDVVLPENLQEIGSRGFLGCYKARTFILPEKLVSIGPNAFAECDSLEEITLPESLESIGEGAFKDCPSLRKVTVLCDPEIIPDNAFEGCGEIVFDGAGLKEKEPEQLPTETPRGPSPAIEADNPSAFNGIWKAADVYVDGIYSPVSSEEDATWELLFGTADLTLTIENGYVKGFGEEEFQEYEFTEGKLVQLLESTEFFDTSYLSRYISLREDGRLALDVFAMTFYLEKA